MLSLAHSLMLATCITHEIAHDTMYIEVYGISVMYFLMTSTYFTLRHIMLYHHVLSIIAIAIMVDRPENTTGRLIFACIEAGNVSLYPINIAYRLNPEWYRARHAILILKSQITWYASLRVFIPLLVMITNTQPFSASEKVIIYVIIAGSAAWSTRLYKVMRRVQKKLNLI